MCVCVCGCVRVGVYMEAVEQAAAAAAASAPSREARRNTRRRALPGAAPRRLIAVSVVQSVASAVLAPSLRHVADMLALSWRCRLTRSAFAKYLAGERVAGRPRAWACLPAASPFRQLAAPARPPSTLPLPAACCRPPAPAARFPPPPPPPPPTPHTAGNTFYTTSQLAGMTDIDQRLTRDIGEWGAAAHRVGQRTASGSAGQAVPRCRRCRCARCAHQCCCSTHIHTSPFTPQCPPCTPHPHRTPTPHTRRAPVRRPGRPHPHPGQAGGGHLLVLLAAVAPHGAARHGHPLPLHSPGMGQPAVGGLGRAGLAVGWRAHESPSHVVARRPVAPLLVGAREPPPHHNCPTPTPTPTPAAR